MRAFHQSIVASAGLLLYLCSFASGEVGMDPDSPEQMKVRVYKDGFCRMEEAAVTEYFEPKRLPIVESGVHFGLGLFSDDGKVMRTAFKVVHESTNCNKDTGIVRLYSNRVEKGANAMLGFPLDSVSPMTKWTSPNSYRLPRFAN